MNIKHKKKKIAVGCAAGALVLAVAGWSVFAQGKKPAVSPNTISLTAEKMDISKSIQGTGTLAAEHSSDVKVPTGIRLTEVKVKVGEEVKPGDVLALADGNTVSAELLSAKEKLAETEKKLKKADSKKADFYNLAKEKQNLEEKINILNQIAQTNSIIAPVSGVVAAANGTVGEVRKASGNTSGGNGAGDNQPASLKRTKEYMPEDSIVRLNETGESQTAVSVEIPEIKLGVPVAGQPQMQQLNETEHYTGAIEWNHPAEYFAEKTVYAARITLTAKSGFYFHAGTEPKVEGAAISDVTYTGEGNIQSIAFTAIFPETGEEVKEEEKPSDPTETEGEKDDNSNQKESSGDAGLPEDSTPPAEQYTIPQEVTAPLSGSGSGGDSGFGTEAGQKEVNTELVSVFTIASGEKMKVVIQIDEMDILSVSVGQKTNITLNALPGEHFDGQISHINKVGSANNGVTKYPVEITVAKNDKMLSGMNVSASVIVEEKKGVLAVPAAAVTEEGGKSYVFTSLDEKTGALSGKKEVITGMTDGASIEIIKGITEGSKLHYVMPENSGNNQEEAMVLEDQVVM